MSDRLENLVCAVLQSGVIQPLSSKIAMRVYGAKLFPQKPTLEDLDKFSATHDEEVAERAVFIAQKIAAKISDIELKELEMNSGPRADASSVAHR